MMTDRGWSEVVIKPAVSAASFGTRRFGRDRLEAGREFLAQLAAAEDAMVQRYMPGVEHPGERAVVFVDGRLSHAVRKSPRLSGDEESVTDVELTDVERDVATRALETVGVPEARSLLYARVDLVHDETAGPVVSEVELMEPSLFLRQHPPALAALVRAIAREAAHVE